MALPKHTPTKDTTADETRLTEIRRQRARAVTAPEGTLSLVNTQWITGEVGASQPIWGVPGLWSPRPAGMSGLHLAATAADRIQIDGETVAGDVIVLGMDDAHPSRIHFSDTVTGTVIANEDGEYALRVWDSRSEGVRDFGEIEAFPHDPTWVVEGTFTPHAGTGPASIAHLADEGRTRPMAVPGEIRFTRNGEEHALVAFDDGPSLLLIFADATNGDTSYSVGRFLRVRPGDDRTVTLDFNLAYLPQCAFSYNFTCPIPPAQNRLGIAVEAGERNVLDKHGDPLH
ncbi:MAG: DUF1684 domain-containing protein [Cryobacterium sp.]